MEGEKKEEKRKKKEKRKEIEKEKRKTEMPAHFVISFVSWT